MNKTNGHALNLPFLWHDYQAGKQIHDPFQLAVENSLFLRHSNEREGRNRIENENRWNTIKFINRALSISIIIS